MQLWRRYRAIKETWAGFRNQISDFES
jgi:hypothetical protein